MLTHEAANRPVLLHPLSDATVEDMKTYQKLRDYGCEIAQGFYFSAALPADEIVAYFRASGASAPAAVTRN